MFLVGQQRIFSFLTSKLLFLTNLPPPNIIPLVLNIYSFRNKAKSDFLTCPKQGSYFSRFDTQFISSAGCLEGRTFELDVLKQKKQVNHLLTLFIKWLTFHLCCIIGNYLWKYLTRVLDTFQTIYLFSVFREKKIWQSISAYLFCKCSSPDLFMSLIGTRPVCTWMCV